MVVQSADTRLAEMVAQMTLEHLSSQRARGLEVNAVVWHYTSGRSGTIQYISHDRKRVVVHCFKDHTEEWRHLNIWVHPQITFIPISAQEGGLTRRAMLVDWAVLQTFMGSHTECTPRHASTLIPRPLLIPTLAATLTAC